MTTPFDDNTPPRRPGLLAGLRSSFLTGLIVIAPIGLTIWLIWTVVGWIDGFVLPLVPNTFQPEQYIGINLRGVGVMIFLIFTVIVGWIAKGLIGRSLINWAESIVERTPVVRSIYSGIKQIAETVFAQSERSFEKACLIEYPRRGIWAIGSSFQPTPRAKSPKSRKAKMRWCRSSCPQRPTRLLASCCFSEKGRAGTGHDNRRGGEIGHLGGSCLSQREG